METLQDSSSQAEKLSTELKAEQALGLIGVGLVQKLMRESGNEWTWSQSESADSGRPVDLLALRQRLELTSLAIQTGAPLSTAEVTKLLGARPGSQKVERGGLIAKRVSRNVWKLSRANAAEDNDQGFRGDGFRRRL
ncbi:MAG: hypothetical protein GY914_11795 [Prochlorococcus sp.]|nr:hypothetical protein [Prochlorococcus sp.]